MQPRGVAMPRLQLRGVAMPRLRGVAMPRLQLRGVAMTCSPAPRGAAPKSVVGRGVSAKVVSRNVGWRSNGLDSGSSACNRSQSVNLQPATMGTQPATTRSQSACSLQPWGTQPATARTQAAALDTQPAARGTQFFYDHPGCNCVPHPSSLQPYASSLSPHAPGLGRWNRAK